MVSGSKKEALRGCILREGVMKNTHIFQLKQLCRSDIPEHKGEGAETDWNPGEEVRPGVISN